LRGDGALALVITVGQTRTFLQQLVGERLPVAQIARRI
jgi:hypothetical protein